jgi:hypothetical protein
MGARRERRSWKWPCNRSPRDRRDLLSVNNQSTSEHGGDSEDFVGDGPLTSAGQHGVVLNEHPLADDGDADAAARLVTPERSGGKVPSWP